MTEKNKFNRRRVLKSTGTTIAGFGAISGSATAEADEQSVGTFNAENYIEGEKYTYRRVRTSVTDVLFRLNVKKGEAKFAEIDSEPGSQNTSTSSVEDEPLREQVEIMVSESDPESMESSSEDNRLNPTDPSEIIDETPGIQTQSSGTIFEKVDATAENIESCDSVLFSDHNYYHVAFELKDYDLDTIPKTVGWGAFCDALFYLVGSKSKVVKKALKALPDSLTGKVGRGIPDSLCGILFGNILDGVFSGGDGTVALWDIDDDGWITEAKIAIGSSEVYDVDPDHIQDYGKVDEFTSLHTSELI